jgi:drug/metabolite transporter (DMT)-like permease
MSYKENQIENVTLGQGRSILGFVAVILHFYAIQRLTVADAMIIGSCSPVFVTLVAHVFLGEKCGVFPIVAAVLTMLGVGVIARPPLLTGAQEYDTDILVRKALIVGPVGFKMFMGWDFKSVTFLY